MVRSFRPPVATTPPPNYRPILWLIVPVSALILTVAIAWLFSYRWMIPHQEMVLLENSSALDPKLVVKQLIPTESIVPASGPTDEAENPSPPSPQSPPSPKYWPVSPDTQAQDLRIYFGNAPNTIYEYVTLESGKRLSISIEPTPAPPGTQRVTCIVNHLFGQWQEGRENRYQVQNDADGLSLIQGRILKILLMPGKGKVGTSWTHPISDQILQSRTLRTVSEKVMVPAGTFTDCLVIEQECSSQKNKALSWEYYAPHIGLIKKEYTDPRFHGNNLELLSYRKSEK